MSSYIPPIESEKIYKLHVERFDPDRDRHDGRRRETFEVPWVPTMTVIEALEWLCDQGTYVAYRANCRELTCGSCAMLIDGKPSLACDTPFTDGKTLASIDRYRVLRDLVVDTSLIQTKWKKLELWPNKPGPVEHVSASILAAWHRSYARCIECYACLAACPASESDTASFAGPMWMLQLGRARAHPLDDTDRLAQVVAEGAGRCVSCYECANVCPVLLSPVSEIHKLRRAALWNCLTSWLR